jgi:polyribonucleotide nucleotidyltransferase
MNAINRIMGLIEYGLEGLNEEEASNAVHDLKKIIELVNKLDEKNAKLEQKNAKLELINEHYLEGIEKSVSEIDGFWEALHNSYNVESREEIEVDCKESWAEGTSPLAVALHYVWKREPKVEQLRIDNEELNNKLMKFGVLQAELIRKDQYIKGLEKQIKESKK